MILVEILTQMKVIQNGDSILNVDAKINSFETMIRTIFNEMDNIPEASFDCQHLLLKRVF